MSAALATDLADAAERLLAAVRNVERHLLAHAALTDPVDLRSDSEKFDAAGNLRVQGSGGGTPSLADVSSALADVSAAHAALSGALAGASVPSAAGA